MIPQKLLEYLGKKKSEGYPDGIIKQHFLSQGWPTEILDEAYTSLNSKAILQDAKANEEIIVAMTPIMPKPVTELPPVGVNTQSEQIEIPKKWLTSLLILFILLSSQYSSIASRVLMIMILYQKVLFSLPGSGSVISNFPGLYVAVILSLATSIYFFYLSFKIRNFSNKSWKLGLASTIVTPILLYPIINLLCLPMLKMTLSPDAGKIQFILPGIELLYIVAILFILWRTRTLHNRDDESISTKFKIWITIVGMIFTFTLISAGYVLSRGNTSIDMNYQTIAQQVSYKVYQVDALPQSLVYATEYSISLDETGENIVKVSFDKPITEIAKSGSELIGITQQKSTLDYDVRTDFRNKESSIQPIEVSIAVNNVGYLVKDGFLNKLEFVTNDGVLIKIVSPKAQDESLIYLAQHLY